jgi:hypothetical protein
MLCKMNNLLLFHALIGFSVVAKVARAGTGFWHGMQLPATNHKNETVVQNVAIWGMGLVVCLFATLQPHTLVRSRQ